MTPHACGPGRSGYVKIRMAPRAPCGWRFRSTSANNHVNHRDRQARSASKGNACWRCGLAFCACIRHNAGSPSHVGETAMRKSEPSRPALPSLGESSPLVPPLFQSSVYTLPDLDALDRITDGEAPGFIYARDAHPNARHLAAQIAALEGGEWALICGSGMAAISAIVLSTVGQGDRIVASNRLYGRTTQLLDRELPRYGVRTEFVDCGDLDRVRAALDTPARLLFVETMSNPL